MQIIEYKKERKNKANKILLKISEKQLKNFDLKRKTADSDKQLEFETNLEHDKESDFVCVEHV